MFLESDFKFWAMVFGAPFLKNSLPKQQNRFRIVVFSKIAKICVIRFNKPHVSFRKENGDWDVEEKTRWNPQVRSEMRWKTQRLTTGPSKPENIQIKLSKSYQAIDFEQSGSQNLETDFQTLNALLKAAAQTFSSYRISFRLRSLCIST